MISTEDLAYWYWIDSVKGLGPLRLKRLLLLFENDLRRVFELREEQLLCIRGIDEKITRAFVDAKSRFDDYKSFAAIQSNRAEKLGARILTLLDDDYPQALLHTTASPPILYAKSSPERIRTLSTANAIAVVGTRRPTPGGLRVAETLGRLFADKGWIVVSGLAIGVDAAAHSGALSANAPSIGVLGCGVDVVYPQSNSHLFEAIAVNGILFSEYPFGARPSEVNLRKRNKITVGLSKAVVVVETGETGGTWNAIRAAQEQKKKVCVLEPAEPAAPSVMGNLKLLEEKGTIPFSLDNAENVISNVLES